MDVNGVHTSELPTSMPILHGTGDATVKTVECHADSDVGQKDASPLPVKPMDKEKSPAPAQTVKSVENEKDTSPPPAVKPVENEKDTWAPPVEKEQKITKDTPPQADKPMERESDTPPQAEQPEEEEEVKQEKQAPKKRGRRRKADIDTTQDDSVSGDENKKVGELEKSAVIEDGRKRSRKKVERLSEVLDKDFQAKTEKEKNLVVEGRGTRLCDISYIDRNLSYTKPADLKLLHTVAFNRSGTVHKIRNNLRNFSGFDFPKESPLYKKKEESLNRRKVKELRLSLGILALDKSGTREEQCERILEFMLMPREVDNPVLDKSTKKKTKSDKPRKKRSKSTDKKKKSGEKQKKKRGSDSEVGSDSEKDSDTENEEEGEKDGDSSGVVSDVSMEKKEKKENVEKKEKKEKKGKKEKVEKKKKEKIEKTTKKSPKKRKATDSAEQSPKKKKTKTLNSDDEAGSTNGADSSETKRLPSDDDLVAKVKELLKDADLERVTMKTVCQQMFDSYPENDLSHKKEFIKKVVKDVLSSS